jgi:mono/diheme cytochrome c family protein
MRHVLSLSIVLFVMLGLACFSTPPDPQAGAALVKRFKCAGCHGADLSGESVPVQNTLAYPGNLTPDPATGLGTWTDDQIVAAVRGDVDAGFCTGAMPRFRLEDAQAATLVTYLRSLAPIVNAVPPSDCTGPPRNDLDDAAVDDAGVIIITNGS